MRVYYRLEKPVPIDPAAAYRLVRAATKGQREAVDRVLGEFFDKREDGWHNKRCDEEIDAYQRQASTNRRIARERIVNEPSDESLNESSTNRERNVDLTTNHKPRTREEAPQRSRGSRLPADWRPSEILVAWAEKERPDLRIPEVIERFRDHWHSVPGAKGCKLDWEATFRNWVRNERKGAAPRPEPGRLAI